MKPLSARSVQNILLTAAIALAFSVFFQAASEHAQRYFHVDLIHFIFSTAHAADWHLVLSPCLIFVITTVVYYRFIIEYTGEIAGLSVIGLLAALFCCVQLLESEPDDWAAHLRWVYVLFYSYVGWDIVMLEYLLPREKNKRFAEADEKKIILEADEKEIKILNRNINWPTLIGVFLMWGNARFIKDSEYVSNFVNGVVAFHLVFASIVAVANFRFGSPEGNGTEENPAGIGGGDLTHQGMDAAHLPPAALPDSSSETLLPDDPAASH